MQALNPKVKELLQKLQQMIMRRNLLLSIGRRCYVLRLRIWWHMVRLHWMEAR